MKSHVLVIDQGTTSSRAMVFDRAHKVVGLGQHDGAGAAVAFAAALLGAGAGQVFAQQVEQGAVGGDVVQGLDGAAADESDGLVVHGVS